MGEVTRFFGGSGQPGRVVRTQARRYTGSRQHNQEEVLPLRKTWLLAACLAVLILALPLPAYASWYFNRPPAPPAPAPAPVPAPQPSPSPGPQPPAGSGPVPLTSEEAVALQLVNQARVEAGLPPLIADPVLTDLARKKSHDMVVNKYFSHDSPTYGTAYQMEVAAGIRAPVMGAENIAKARNARYAHAMFMSSQGHRTNILNPRHTHVGIGIVANGAYGIAETQMFIGR